MSRSRHTEAQMIAALKQVEAGRAVEDVAREEGVSKHTIYGWKAKYGGMDVGRAQEAKQLRDENTRLRKLVADLSLDKEALQSVTEKTGGARSVEGSYRQMKQEYAFSAASVDRNTDRDSPSTCSTRATGTRFGEGLPCRRSNKPSYQNSS